jgi:pimeloyl-ACP methyl ester carboxylesterase
VQCATVDLPLDYDDPTGATTPVSVARVPASGRKIGSLFVNPGGPGGSARDFARYAGFLIGPGIRRHFDVVGVDPRGVGAPPYALCRYPSEDAPPALDVPYPVTQRQAGRQIRADRVLDDDCATGRNAVVDHMSTADYVRDIDVVRQAVGDDQLTYYGISYGSMVGQTYAAMFPDRVRAIVVDGVLDPIEWTSGTDPSLPSTYRLGSGRGAHESLISALRECDRVGRDRCSIAGHAEHTWRRTYRLARQGELRVDGHRVIVQDLVGTALSSLYHAPTIKRQLVRFLHDVAEQRRHRTARTARALASSWAGLVRVRERQEAAGPYGYAPSGRAATNQVSDVAFESVVCSDALNPTDPWAWQRASRTADTTQPWFGRLWTWRSSPCAGWTWPGAGDDAFRGPWPTTTSTPLLVVGNRHDPATPIQGARAATRQFAGSVLLTLNGWGHGALNTSACIRKRMSAYLIDRDLPRADTVCRPYRPLFP